MRGVAKPWRNGYWRVKFDNGLDLYPITADELEQAKRHHDIRIAEAQS